MTDANYMSGGAPIVPEPPITRIRPGTWTEVRTDAGWHLRLVAANGQIVLTSEVYSHPKAVTAALALVERSTDFTLHSPVYVDERSSGETERPWNYVAKCEQCGPQPAFSSHEARATWTGTHRVNTGHTVSMWQER